VHFRGAPNLLVHHGIQPFDRILVMLPNVTALWECTLAAIKLPAVIIPTSTLLTPAELTYRIQEAKIQHVITSMAEIHKFADMPSSIRRIVVDERAYEESCYHSEEYSPTVQSQAHDPLLQYFTSGTTSKPKLVTHTHQSYPVGHLSTMYWTGLDEHDVHLNVSTAGWGKHAWSSFFAPWNAGATVMAYGYSRFNIEQFLQCLVENPVTSLCAPPTVWNQLCQKPLKDYPISLRQGLSAGEPLSPKTMAVIKDAWGFIPREGYGQTETTALIGYSLGQEVIPGAMGYPLPGYQLKVVNPEGKEVEEGELAVVCHPERPIGLMQGYSDLSKTNQVMAGGLYRTGDILRRDKNGLFFFVGRDNDVFKSSGYRISPFELEAAMLEHPAVLEAAVVPKPDEIKGNIPKAFITLRQGYEDNAALREDIMHFLEKRLASSHRVREIEVCTELPKTISGKIRRVELKQKEIDLASPMNATQKRGYDV
jgi:acetyl-CoA synthetase